MSIMANFAPPSQTSPDLFDNQSPLVWLRCAMLMSHLYGDVAKNRSETFSGVIVQRQHLCGETVYSFKCWFHFVGSLAERFCDGGREFEVI